ncbi:hypothetical protein [Porphyrobacter sp. YT40]|uniref:hypothetical protein n=1 Tax=Porphyrobacter sp. YT40 TaxID=2547601 RepID=UPI0015E89C5D|nr:hypothetical protein [Porphyrobacter sp. YT40]
MGEDSTDDTRADRSGGGRRQGDRRKAQVPFEGPDRRQGDRRSGTDRRTTPREDSEG